MMENRPIEVLNLKRVQELETWLQTTKTKLIQVNGQRKYGGPPEVWDGPPPGARCEVFISQIPRDTYEDVLIPLFSSVGPVWEFRLMMNFSGENRGFAYAKYSSPVVATSAIRKLNGYMLEHGSPLCVRHSTEKRHICVGDLPATTRPEDLLQVLHMLTEGVERVSLKTGPGIEGVCAIIAFSSHHAASMAKKGMAEVFQKHLGMTVSVKWQSSMKPSLDEALSLQTLPKDGSVHASAFRQPRHILSSAQPPRLARRPSVPPGFCRAVGGPVIPRHSSPPTCPSSLMHQVSTTSPKMLLSMLCEASGMGQPIYEIYPHHLGHDGFLHFSYKVCIPGISATFEGPLMILPGPSTTSTMEEAWHTVAQQVLQRICRGQVA